MKRIRGLTRSLTFAATCFSCVVLTGCYSWHQASVSPQTLSSQNGKTVRVHSNGARYVIENPEIQQDTLIASNLRIALEDVNEPELLFAGALCLHGLVAQFTIFRSSPRKMPFMFMASCSGL